MDEKTRLNRIAMTKSVIIKHAMQIARLETTAHYLDNNGDVVAPSYDDVPAHIEMHEAMIKKESKYILTLMSAAPTEPVA